MLHRFTRVLRPTEKDGVGSSGGGEGKLIKGDDFTTGFQDASTGGFCDAQSANAELGDIVETDIVGDGAHDDGGLAFLALHEVCELGEGERRSVDLGHEEASENDLVEIAVGAANQEAVELQG